MPSPKNKELDPSVKKSPSSPSSSGFSPDLSHNSTIETLPESEVDKGRYYSDEEINQIKGQSYQKGILDNSTGGLLYSRDELNRLSEYWYKAGINGGMLVEVVPPPTGERKVGEEGYSVDQIIEQLKHSYKLGNEEFMKEGQEMRVKEAKEQRGIVSFSTLKHLNSEPLDPLLETKFDENIRYQHLSESYFNDCYQAGRSGQKKPLVDFVINEQQKQHLDDNSSLAYQKGLRFRKDMYGTFSIENVNLEIPLILINRSNYRMSTEIIDLIQEAYERAVRDEEGINFGNYNDPDSITYEFIKAASNEGMEKFKLLQTKEKLNGPLTIETLQIMISQGYTIGQIQQQLLTSLKIDSESIKKGIMSFLSPIEIHKALLSIDRKSLETILLDSWDINTQGTQLPSEGDQVPPAKYFDQGEKDLVKAMNSGQIGVPTDSIDKHTSTIKESTPLENLRHLLESESSALGNLLSRLQKVTKKVYNFDNLEGVEDGVGRPQIFTPATVGGELRELYKNLQVINDYSQGLNDVLVLLERNI